MRSLDFRAAHAWLRGYSDCKGFKPQKFPATMDEAFKGDYDRGYMAPLPTMEQLVEGGYPDGFSV